MEERQSDVPKGQLGKFSQHWEARYLSDERLQFARRERYS